MLTMEETGGNRQYRMQARASIKHGACHAFFFVFLAICLRCVPSVDTVEQMTDLDL